MIGILIFSINLIISLGEEYNLSFNELKKKIENKKEKFLQKIYSLNSNLKDKIKIKKELILSQKILVEIPDSLLDEFQKLSIPYSYDHLIPLPKLLHSNYVKSFWHKKFIGADTFYKLNIRGRGNIIVIIDTGVDTSHPELKGKVIGFKDFVSYSPPSDPLGHGTFVASLVVGDSAGIAPESKIIVLKVFSEYGGFVSDIHEAFDYVAELLESGLSIRILNGSFGTHPNFDEFFPDLFYLKKKGVFLCFAAGNEGPSSGTTSSPSNYPFVFSVGACDSHFNVTNFSSRGPSPFSLPWGDTSYWFFKDWNFLSPLLIAPGKSIKGAFLNKSFVTADGTSASSPILAGALSLLLEYNPFLTPDSVAKIFKENLKRKYGRAYPNYEEGYGYIDLEELIKVINRYDTLIFAVEDFYVDSKTAPPFPSDTLEIGVSLISNRVLNDSVKIKILNNSNIFFFDTLFKFPQVRRNVKFFTKGILLSYPEDTLEIYFSLSSRNFSKLFKLKKVFSDTLITFRNQNYTFSISATGALGFASSDQKKGIGFVFKNFGNLLYYGSIAFGNDYNYVVDRFYEKFNIDDRDTRPLKDGRFYFNKEGEYIVFKIKDEYSQHPKGNVLKVKIRDLNEGFLINLKTENFLSEEVYLATFLDPDIKSPLFNYADYDSASKILFTSISEGPVFGLLDIDEHSLCGIIKNEEFVYPYGGLPDSIQFSLMKGELKRFWKDIGDYSIYISKKIIPPDSLVYVLFAGENFDSLLSKRERILGKLNLTQKNTFRGISRIYPNPFIDPYQKNLKILTYGKGKLIFYDISGRKTATISTLNEGLNIIRLNNFKNSGVYFVKFEEKKKIFKFMYLNLR
ncbi:MAG: S8 family peptidase [Candidatus Hydrothermales bacterium]